MPESKRLISLTLLLASVMLAGCSPSDPRAGILEERARWDVRLLNWAQDAEGSINISTRVSGPPNSELEKLTVRVKLLDADDSTVDSIWHTYDLEQVPRGGPSDLFIRIPRASQSITGLALDMVLMPSPEEQARIVELQL
jgi:hypothetical protein